MLGIGSGAAQPSIIRGRTSGVHRLRPSMLARVATLGLMLWASPDPAQAQDPLKTRVDEIIQARELAPIDPPPPVRPALRELGRLLNFDPILSGNRNIACATCHHPTLGTGDARHLPLGTDGEGLGSMRGGGGIVPRNAPPLFNLHAYQTMFWDNRIEFRDRELVTPADDFVSAPMRDVFEFGLVSAQALFPVTSHTEMAGQPGQNPIADARDKTQLWSRLTQRVLEIEEYRIRLAQAYPEQQDWNFAHIANAIAAFQIDAYARIDTPWQRYLLGDKDALTPAQLRGAITFFDSGCGDCHSGPMFSDFRVHNSGLPNVGPGKDAGRLGIEDWGRMLISGDTQDKHRFRTSVLVNVELSAPFGHAGQFPTLREYIQHYQDPRTALMSYDSVNHIPAYEPWLWLFDHPKPTEIAATLDPLIEDLRPFAVDEILDFLSALTDPQARALAHEIPDRVPSGLALDTPPRQQEPGCDHNSTRR